VFTARAKTARVHGQCTWTLKGRSHVRARWYAARWSARDSNSMHFSGGVHTYAALRVAALVKTQRVRFYQRGAATRSVCVNGP